MNTVEPIFEANYRPTGAIARLEMPQRGSNPLVLHGMPTTTGPNNDPLALQVDAEGAIRTTLGGLKEATCVYCTSYRIAIKNATAHGASLHRITWGA